MVRFSDIDQQRVFPKTAISVFSPEKDVPNF